MQPNQMQRSDHISFWIAVLLHLLLLLSFLLAIHFKPDKEETPPPQHYISSYMMQATKPLPQVQRQMRRQSSMRARPLRTNQIKTNNHSAQAEYASSQAQPETQQVSRMQNQPSADEILASSYRMFHSNQIQSLKRVRKLAKPLLLIGDEHSVADPFKQLIGEALSAYFMYPELEGRMGIKGKVLIELTLHPEGYFDDVLIVESSNNQNLDAAALYAVNKAPLVKGANKFLQAPKRFVVGFVFL